MNAQCMLLLCDAFALFAVGKALLTWDGHSLLRWTKYWGLLAAVGVVEVLAASLLGLWLPLAAAFRAAYLLGELATAIASCGKGMAASQPAASPPTSPAQPPVHLTGRITPPPVHLTGRITPPPVHLTGRITPPPTSGTLCYRRQGAAASEPDMRRRRREGSLGAAAGPCVLERERGGAGKYDLRQLASPRQSCHLCK